MHNRISTVIAFENYLFSGKLILNKLAVVTWVSTWIYKNMRIQFLGIHIHDSINWSCHIEYIIPKLNSACYIMRSIKPFISLNTLKTHYYSYFIVIISYGLPFWGNSPHSIKIFRMQKRIIRIMIGCKNRVSCRNLFRRLEILPFVSQYIL